MPTKGQTVSGLKHPEECPCGLSGCPGCFPKPSERPISRVPGPASADEVRIIRDANLGEFMAEEGPLWGDL